MQMEEEIRVLVRQRDLAQSRVEDLLQTARKDGASRLDELLALESSHKVKITRNAYKDFDEHQLRISDAIEDNFLLDDSTPRFSGPDPCQGWEDAAQRYSLVPEVKWKEVRCIDEEGSSVNREIHHALGTDDALVPHLKENEKKLTINSYKPMEDGNLSHTHEECIHLKQKVQQLQRTIEYLIRNYPLEQSSSISEKSEFSGLRFSRSASGRSILTFPSLFEQETAASESLQFSRSKSGRSVLTIPASWVVKEDEKTQPDGYKKDSQSNSRVDMEVKNEKGQPNECGKDFPSDASVEEKVQSKNTEPNKYEKDLTSDSLVEEGVESEKTQPDAYGEDLPDNSLSGYEKDLPNDSLVEKGVESEKTQPSLCDTEFSNSSLPEKEVTDEKPEPSSHGKDLPSNNTGKLSRNDSQSSAESDMTDSEIMRTADFDDDDDKTTVLNYSVRTNKFNEDKRFSNESVSKYYIVSLCLLVYAVMHTCGPVHVN